MSGLSAFPEVRWLVSRPMALNPFKILAREWRAGELTILSFALFLSVSVATAISAFTERLDSALTYESHRFLAADLVVRSSRSLPAEWSRQAISRGLELASSMAFPTMLYAPLEDRMRLVSIKAVSSSYPLRGELLISEKPFAQGTAVDFGPGRGEVWIESRLFSFLGVEVGDSVSLGEGDFSVTAVIRSEPDRGDAFSGVGPRVLMNIEDVSETEIIQPGSRVEYRQLYAGDQNNLDDFSKWLAPQIQPGQTVLGLGEIQPNIARAMDRVEIFLVLSGSLTIILAGAAISSASGRFAERHTAYVAIMKALGSRSGSISLLYAQCLGILGLLSGLFGCFFGFILQAIAFSIVGERLPVDPGSSGIKPYLAGAATSFVCLLVFSWPSIRRLSLANPMKVLGRDLADKSKGFVADYSIGLLSLTLLIFFYSQNWQLVLSLVLGLVIVAILGVIISLAFLTSSRVLGMRAGSVWRLAFAGLKRRGLANGLQVVVFAVAIMMLLVLLGIRTSLLNQWEAQLPAETPNHFLLNIGPSDVEKLEAFLKSASISEPPMFPIIRGRIISINNEALPSKDPDGAGRRQREANFTWSEALPESNKILSGSWWSGNENKPVVSIEEDYARRMGLSVGDVLGLQIGDYPLEAVVASIREVDWQSFRPNFFMIFPKKTLSDFSSTFMTSFYLSQDQKPVLNQLVRQFPTITVIEMDVVLEQIREIIDEVSAIIELVLVLVIAAGSLVLISGVQASLDSRMTESAVLRVMGARKKLILGGLLIEFSTLGLFAGVLACFGAEASIYIVLTWILDAPYAPIPWVWLVGISGAMLLIGTIGVLSSRKVVLSSPLLILRE